MTRSSRSLRKDEMLSDASRVGLTDFLQNDKNKKMFFIIYEEAVKKIGPKAFESYRQALVRTRRTRND